MPYSLLRTRKQRGVGSSLCGVLGYQATREPKDERSDRRYGGIAG